jgi:hypothetical protein
LVGVDLEEATMGDWFTGPDGAWHHTDDVPAPDPTVTAMMPAVAPAPREPAGQDDLTSFDQAFDISNTEKLGPLDEVLVQPPQDPAWRPA